MKTFLVKLKKNNSEERAIHRLQFLTFQDAVSKAYMIRAGLGNSWIIDSVSEEQCS